MAVRLALLRAVNVGGAGKVAMADLRAFFEALGFENVRSYIQSGNIIFESPKLDDANLEGFLEREARTRLNLDTSFIVRTPEEWDAVIRVNPLSRKAEEDPRRLLVMALKDQPSPEQFSALRADYDGPEPFELVGKHLYIDYLEGAGNSRLTNVFIERRLATRGTARNWNTVIKLSEMLRD